MDNRVLSADLRRRRGSSAGLTSKVKTMDDTIQHLTKQLIQSRADTEKVKDQLNCLVDLIKRHWRGDQNAALHICQIIGVKPPKANIRKSYSEHTTTTARTHAENNWVLLVVGLLRKHYDSLRRSKNEYQQLYFQHRHAYLDQQMLLERDLRARLRLDKSKTYDLALNTDKINGFHRGHTHHERANLLTKQLTEKAALFDSHAEASEPVEDDADYDDFRRYTRSGLYDSAPVTRANSRPISGVQMRANDARRARPKTAAAGTTNLVLTEKKPSRPLKYETTRPVSAPTHDRVRPALKTTKVKVIPEHDELLGVPNAQAFVRQINIPDGSEGGEVIEEMSDDTPQLTEEEKEQKELRVRISRPAFIKEFENSLEKQQELEDDFKKTTIYLQKKLGISDKAMI